MFKISPIQDKTRQKEVAEACGAVYSEEMLAYEMTDAESGALMGFSQFELNEHGGLLCDLCEIPGGHDTEAMFILGRATMSFIEKLGITDCYAKPDAGDEKLLRMIGFRPADGGLLFCDMTGMFSGHCSGHPVDLGKD